jgi:hypothetical protein
MKRLLLFFFAIPFIANSQSVRIKKVELAGEKVIVTYDLEFSNAAQGFLINLYGSKDNFGIALTKVTGDVGPEVKPGINKKIEWKIRDEYGGYKGKLSLEIRGKVYTPFVKLQAFDVTKAYKLGKQYDILWKPGNADPVNIELYKGSQRIQGDMGQPNSGAFTLHIPATIKKGNDYRLKFTDSKNPDEVLYTPTFKISPKVPTVAKILVPLVVVGGVAAAVFAGGGTPETPPDSAPESIALPDIIK